MRYQELRTHVWILFSQARYGHVPDPTYRKWIVGRTHDRICDAALVADDAPDELGTHIAHDYRLEGQELDRFRFWWAHVLQHGFDGPNPLAHIYKGKVTA